MCQVTQDAVFLRHLLLMMGVERHQPRVVLEDHLGAVDSAKSNALSKRSRRVENKYQYTWEQLKVETITLRHIASKEQPDDLPTKNLQVFLSPKFRNIILGISSR